MLSVQDLVVRWRAADERPVLDGVSMDMPRGAIGVLLGPSGCGKTTLLRTVAGLERAQSGRIVLGGQVVADPAHKVHCPAEQRRVGMVFQDFALFPHLTVAGNIAFGLNSQRRNERLDRAARRRRVGHMLALVGLSDLADRWPHQLSGGQQQRVALARALAPSPDLLLLDEPFSSLDTTLRERLAQELRQIIKDSGTTALFVTHDQTEAFALGDLVGVMQQGQLHQWDAPQALYHAPASRFVAEFVGQGVLLQGQIAGQDLLLRAHDVTMDEHSEVRADVLRSVFRGADTLCTLRLADGRTLHASVPAHTAPQAGAKVGIRIRPREVVTFARQESPRARF